MVPVSRTGALRHLSEPIKVGVSIAIARLPYLADAIMKALAKARELGLVAEVPK